MSNKPIIGPSSGFGYIVGTTGDDFIVASGPFNQISTDGGADFIIAGDGGGLIIIGGPDAPNEAPIGTTIINLKGTGNVIQTNYGGTIGVIIDGQGPYAVLLPVYSGAVSVVGYDGRNTVDLGEGQANIDLGGYGNTVHIGGGSATIRLPGGGAIPPDGLPTAGYNDVTVGGGAPTGLAIDDTVLLAGFVNQVTNDSFTQQSPTERIERAGTLSIIGGAGSGVFSTAGADTTLRTTGTGNTVNVGLAGTSTIAPGDGHDTVDIGANSSPYQAALANVTVTLNGQYNVVSGLAQSLTITGGDGHATYNLTSDTLADGSNVQSEYGVVNGQTFYSFYNRTYSVTAGGLYNNFTLDDTNSNTIVSGGGYATVTLRDPVFQAQGDPPVAPTKLNVVTMMGNRNTLTAGNGQTAVYADGYGDTITLGNGFNKIISTRSADDPAGNTITVGSGHNQVSLSNGDTVHLNGGTDTVSLKGLGRQSMVFLGSGEKATISGYAGDLTLDVLAGNVSATLNPLAMTTPPTVGSIILEAGTVAAGTTAAQLLSALHGDGHGGTALSLAGGGVLDFTGTSSSQFSAADFILRS